MESILGDGTAEEHRGITSSSPTKAGLDPWKTNRGVVFITLITFFDNALYGAIVPFMSLHLLQTVHLTMLEVGVVFAAFGGALLVGTFLFRNVPYLAMLPPRWMILTSALGLFASCAVMSYYYTSYRGLVLGRAIHGVASASLQTAAMRYVHDSFEPTSLEAPMGKIMSSMASGMLAGPLLGGIAAQVWAVTTLMQSQADPRFGPRAVACIMYACACNK